MLCAPVEPAVIAVSGLELASDRVLPEDGDDVRRPGTRKRPQQRMVGRGKGGIDLGAAAAALSLVLLVLGSCACGPVAASVNHVMAKIVVVAAENEYGSMAQAIGGNRVTVTSLLTNPNTDPHEFEASASTAVTLSKAQLVIKNGLGYDAWIDKLLSASPRAHRVVLSVGEYLGHRNGDNPHNHTARMLFYNSQVTDPTTTNMRHIAAQSHVPIVGVTETQPPSRSFVQWQLSQLESIKRNWK